MVSPTMSYRKGADSLNLCNVTYNTSRPFLEDTLGTSKKLHVSVSWSVERLWFKLILKSL